jgi:hypothetical protein
LLIPYPVATDTPDVPRDILALANRIEAIWTAAYAAFTPTLNTSGTAAVMLAANRVGRYRQIGPEVDAEAIFTWTGLGSGEGLGTGIYFLGLPVAASSWYQAEYPIGVGHFLDSGLSIYSGTAQINTASQVYVNLAAANSKVAANYPVATPTNADQFGYSVRYTT